MNRTVEFASTKVLQDVAVDIWDDYLGSVHRLLAELKRPHFCPVQKLIAQHFNAPIFSLWRLYSKLDAEQEAAWKPVYCPVDSNESVQGRGERSDVLFRLAQTLQSQ